MNMFYSRTRTTEKTEQKGSVHAIAISTFMVFLCVLFVFLMPLMKKRKSKRKKVSNRITYVAYNNFL